MVPLPFAPHGGRAVCQQPQKGTLMNHARGTLFVLLICCLWACREGNPLPPDHPEYFDHVFHEVDRLNLSPERSFAFLDSVYQDYPSPGLLDRVRRYDYKGQYYFYEARDLKKAMLYVDSSLTLLSGPEARKHYPRQYARALLNKGEIYQYQKNKESALFYLYKGRQAIDTLKDSCTLADYTQRLAMASYHQGRYADAKVFFEQAAREFSACWGDFRGFAYVQSNLDNIGMCYAMMGKWDSAAYYYDSTLAYISERESIFNSDSVRRVYIETARAVVAGNQGDYYLNKRDSVRAYERYQTSIDINMKPRHDSGNALSMLVKLAGLHIAQNHIPQAQQVLATVRATLDRRPSLEIELARRGLLAQWYEKTGAWRDAYRTLNDWRRLKDSLEQLEEPIAAINFPGELQHLEDKYTIQSLNQRDRLKTVYLLLTLLIVVLLVAVLVLIVRGVRRSRKYIGRLNELNEALQIENKQKQLAIHSLNESQANYLQTLKTVAHDLRNPVGAIASTVNMLDHQQPTDDKTRQLHSLIRQATDQSLNLINNILQLEIPVGTLTKEKVDVAQLLETCTGTMQFRANEKGQTLRLEAEPMNVYLDQEKIWRVVINLLDNAIRFSPAGTAIPIKAARGKGEALITVGERGSGSSCGLEEQGLVLAKQIVQAHGGAIRIGGREGDASTFAISLPL